MSRVIYELGQDLGQGHSHVAIIEDDLGRLFVSTSSHYVSSQVEISVEQLELLAHSIRDHFINKRQIGQAMLIRPDCPVRYCNARHPNDECKDHCRFRPLR